jgi:hypothetical protein
VEIKIEMLEEEEDEDEIFDMEMTEHAADMATKLDALMDILFTFLFRETQRSEKHREQVFFILMQLFDTFILKTHKSKYVQFLLFYVCAMDANYVHVPPPSSNFLAFLFSSNDFLCIKHIYLYYVLLVVCAGVRAVSGGEGDGREQPPAHPKHVRGLSRVVPRRSTIVPTQLIQEPMQST